MEKVMTRKELKWHFLKVVKYLSEHGELLKAYFVLRNAPSIIEDEIKDYFKEVKEQIDKLQDYNKHGFEYKDGLIWKNYGSKDPDDVDELPRVKLLLKDIKKLGLKYLVDVGCYSGWLGRRLSLEGIRVLGIDMQAGVVEMAQRKSAGTLAEVKHLNAMILGTIYKEEFDGAVLFDLIEHVFDPDNMILSVEKSLKKGGWVFLTIPKVEEEHRITDVPIMTKREHLQSFSKKKILDMFGKKKNFSIISMDNEEGTTNWFVKYQK